MASEPTIEKRKQYREWMSRSIGFGIVGFIGALAVSLFVADGLPEDLSLFAGVGFYYLGIIGYLVIWQQTGVRLFDEREAEIERRAGQILMLVVMFVAIFGLPADVVLEVTGAITIPPTIRGVIWGYALLSFIGLFAYGYTESQHS